MLLALRNSGILLARMRLVRSRSTGKKVDVAELDQCSMSRKMQPHEAPQRSIGLFAMWHGEGALEFAKFGARGITHRVQSSHTPPMVLYPSVSALEVSQAVENDMVRLHGRCSVANSDSDLSIFIAQRSCGAAGENLA